MFLLVGVLGLYAGRWRKGDLSNLNEWGLGGRSFGIIISWFLVGSDLYTAYTLIALLGFMAIALGLKASGAYGDNGTGAYWCELSVPSNLIRDSATRITKQPSRIDPDFRSLN